MKATLILLSTLLLSGAALADSDPEPVKVYCFSDDTEAGFKDAKRDAFCKRLGDIGDKKGSLVLTSDRSDSHAAVHYLGVGEFAKRGESTFVSAGIAWTPDENANRAGAALLVGDFAKTFESEGSGFRPVGVVAKHIEEWIRENRETILEKTSK